MVEPTTNIALINPAPMKNFQVHEAFMGTLSDALNAQGSDGVVSVGLFDIDWFGKVNDKHGRDAGDSVIDGLSAHLADVAGSRGSVHRYGGDAFAMLMPGVEKEEAFLLLETARASFVEPRVVVVGDRTLELQVGVSAGLASSPDDSSDPPILMRKASEALYRAKVGGRNKVCLAREEKMVTKTSHYAQGQLYGLSRLAKRKGVGEAVMLREALDDLLRKYNS
jgi:diguanylate cyclase (GGDEF)-like protein